MTTPRERVEATLLGKWADRIPFTAYFNKFFPSRVERELRNEGFCIEESCRIQPFLVETPDVSETCSFFRPLGIRPCRRF
jgi:hypothetical protein